MIDETFRLDRVRELKLRTVQRPEVFDRISCLAAEALGCPTALVTVVDEATQWFLGRTGFDRDETPREISFCSVCIASDAALLVNDATGDPRFATNPLVTSEPFVRSYLGVPLRTDRGVLIGALCVISPVPGKFTPEDVGTLNSFALLAKEAILAHHQEVQLRQAKIHLIEHQQVFHQAKLATGFGDWCLDLATNRLRCSKQVFQIYGIAPRAQIDVTSAITSFDQPDRPLLRKALANARKTGCQFRLEATLKRADGRTRRVRVQGERVDIDGRPHSIAGVVVDIDQEYALAKARESADTLDPLTGLLNRAGLSARLHTACRMIAGSTLTVMLIDLDNFADINNTLGHSAGDNLLAILSNRLLARAGKDTAIARWGGDEFALMFPPDTLLEEAIGTGKLLIDAITEEAVLDGEIANPSATCGVAQLSGPCSPHDLIRRADLALNFGKENSRGSLHAWSEDLDSASITRQRAVVRLKHALAERHAFAAYQPIVEIETGKVVGAEALLRINSGSGVLTATDVFPAITDPLMSRKVSRFMLEQVVQDGPELLARFGPDCKIGINVSEADLRFTQGDDDFVSLISTIIQQSALRPRNITLEVTETMLLRDETGGIRDGLRALDGLGYTVALDDFGTGYSSLTHLRDFPIRKVKIDKEFVGAIAWDHQARLIIQAIVQMGRGLGLDVIAEGVENASEEMFLRAIGCRYAQGYRYGKPAQLDCEKPAARARIAG